jgi:SAM-dependent methyltransferase
LAEIRGLEFSGERVIPGLVDENLFNEHLARYRFAARFLPSPSARVLDAGCGSGYGTAQFGPECSVIAIDISHEAVLHAREQYSRPRVLFTQASCEAIPFADGSFDLVVAFEVIEHLERWRDLLAEARRVLRPAGVFLVSTPNKSYYAESRAAAGPNPYHVHEFEYAEFQAELGQVFPHVRLWSQNHAEAVAFTIASPSDGMLDANQERDPSTAHFYFAACSSSSIAHTEAFAWLPNAGNILREREHHIELLETEVGQKTAWLEEQTGRHAELKNAHDALLAELSQRNEWAARLDAEIVKARQVIADLQAEAHARLDWIRDLESQIADGNAEIDRRVAELDELRKVFARRTQWGEEKAEEARVAVEIINRQAAEIETQTALRRNLETTRWLRLGRALGLLRNHPK